jgi:HSP20 family protein
MTNGKTLDSLLDTFFTGWTQAWQPRLDVFDASDGYTIVLEAPGLAEKDVSIECENGVLVVRGEKKPAAPEGATVLRSERGFGAFERRVELAPDVDAAGISAAMKNGLLTIRLPRKPEAQPRRIEVKSAE